jgi:hypothetical protein
MPSRFALAARQSGLGLLVRAWSAFEAGPEEGAANTGHAGQVAEGEPCRDAEEGRGGRNLTATMRAAVGGDGRACLGDRTAGAEGAVVGRASLRRSWCAAGGVGA